MKGHKQLSAKFFSPPKPIGGVVERTIRSLGLEKPYAGWQVVMRWPEIVGPEIARHAEAVRFEDGVLTVAVPSDVWRHQLSLQAETIVQQIHRLPGGQVVERLRLEKGRKRL